VVSRIRDLNLELISIEEEDGMRQRKENRVVDVGALDPGWGSLYRVAGTAALLVVVVGLLDFVLALLQSGAATPGTTSVIDWFSLLQQRTFFGLRNLGMLNIVTFTLGIPLYLALFHIHRRAHGGLAAFATILFGVGAAVYISSNAVFSLLALSGQYAAAATDSQRALLASAGTAILARGEDLTSGTFMGFFLTETGALLMAGLMLQGRVFGRVTAAVGILGMGLMLIFNILAAFATAMYGTALIVAMLGALPSMAWYVLMARRLFQLGRALEAGSR
jgi:hypothetical protein